MKMPKIFLRKIIIGFLLLVMAAGFTLVLKETLDTKDPESALPTISVQYNDGQVQGVYRAGYSWSFFTTIENRQAPSLAPEDLPLTPVAVLPAHPVKITFSKTPSELRIWRAKGRYSTDYLELSNEQEGVFDTPSMPGVYLYKVKADWGSRGTIQYYFALDVQAQ